MSFPGAATFLRRDVSKNELYANQPLITSRFKCPSIGISPRTSVSAAEYGLASRDYGIPNTPHTRYALASMGKMFTATAILQLVDAGRLRLDDALSKVLPRYPNAERAGRITIRQPSIHPWRRTSPTHS